MGISWDISTSCLTRSPNPDHFRIHFFPKVLEVELFAISLRSGYLSEKKIKQQNIKMYPNTSPLGSPLMVHPWFFSHPTPVSRSHGRELVHVDLSQLLRITASQLSFHITRGDIFTPGKSSRTALLSIFPWRKNMTLSCFMGFRAGEN